MQIHTQECYEITTFDIGFIGLYITTDLTPLEVCDDNQDGIAVFNLNEADAEAVDGLDAAAVSVSYHVSQDDADDDVI